MSTAENINTALNALAERADRRFHGLVHALFLLGFLTELVIVIIDKSALVNPYEGRLFQLTFLCFFAALLTERFTLRERGYLAFFLALSLISYLVTGRNELLRCTVFAASMVRMDVRKLMKLFLAVETHRLRWGRGDKALPWPWPSELPPLHGGGAGPSVSLPLS